MANSKFFEPGFIPTIELPLRRTLVHSVLFPTLMTLRLITYN